MNQITQAEKNHLVIPRIKSTKNIRQCGEKKVGKINKKNKNYFSSPLELSLALYLFVRNFSKILNSLIELKETGYVKYILEG